MNEENLKSKLITENQEYKQELEYLGKLRDDGKLINEDMVKANEELE